jgi:hypothetical protein
LGANVGRARFLKLNFNNMTSIPSLTRLTSLT